MFRLIDTHCHVTCDSLFDHIEKIIEKAKKENIERMLIICTNLEEYERAAQLKIQYPNLFDIALGFHPNDLYEVEESDFKRLEELLEEDKLIAVGEIGLDYHWDDVKPEDQIQGFIRQLELAKKYDKPVLIHMREATQDTLDVLDKYSGHKGIIHCFSGSVEVAKQFVKMGFYISFGGPLTFKNSRHAPAVAEAIDLEHIFVETDSPYLTPHPYRGKQNEPSYVRYTFEKLCEIKNVDRKMAAEQLRENYKKLFNV